MNPADIRDGAAVPHNPKFYVIGSFDKRITFYSQQVRALSLVHALHELEYLNDVANIAVIGAGAAGLTVSAAVALASTARVTLFEASPELLPLQMGTARRKLDPHIYDWPRIDSSDEAANLPVLDWESGPSSEVRKDVINEFEQLAIRKRGQLEKRLGHKVKAIERVEKFYKVTYDCIGNPGDNSPKENRSDQFDMVFLAVGFGLELNETIAGIRGISYWSDGGVPNAEFAARDSPRYFISGNGDGALIDLVAAASADFDHRKMIQLIAGHSGMGQVKNVLQDIDKIARLVTPEVAPFNLYEAYEREIKPLIQENGLINRFRLQLRRGVRLTLQTHQADIFNVNTSALNRLAVFATIKACEVSELCSFRHIQCDEVIKVPTLELGRVVLSCDAEQIEVDEIIIRRGPNRDSVRQPFSNIIGEYEAVHDDWLKRYGEAILIPTLSDEARAFFAERALVAELPLSKRLRRQAVANLPVTFKVRVMGAVVHWTGALVSGNIDNIWTTKARYNLILPDGADRLGVLATVILRIASHCQNLTLYADPAYWEDLVREIVTDGRGLYPLDFCGVTLGGATEAPVDFPVDQLAEEMHTMLDRWMLARVSGYLKDYLRLGTDFDGSIGLIIAPDLRVLMTVTWNDWIVSFAHAPNLLKHFLRLMMSTSEVDHDAAQVLVGPKKLSEIIRGVVVSLAIASSWKATAPREARPGNLRRELDGTTEWSGHSYADTRINGKGTLLLAGGFMWQTDFVILAVDGAVEVAQSAEISFRQDVRTQPAFSESFGHEPLVMSISPAFQRAVEAGADALAGLLAEIEAQRLARWRNALETKDVA